jgi:hypothetical protein
MPKIETEAELQNAIRALETQLISEGRLFKTELQIAYENIKPINLIKSTFEQAAASHALKDNVLSTSVGLTVGYISKMLFQGVAVSPIKNIVGTALQFGITNLVLKNPETIKSFGASIFQLIRRKAKDKTILENESI